MSDINTNISVNIDTSGALGQLKALQRQISTFHTSIAKSSQTASLAQADLQKNFLNAVNGIGAFSAELRTVKTSAENFTSSLEKNKFSMREYFRYAGGATQTFGRLFRSEFETINKVATENVKNLQTQYIKMGRDANGAMKAIAVRPLTLDMQNLSTQTQIAAQKQALFNQLVKQGSTNLLNFGKNTQWAGRQLMVGFTLPLMALGTAASKTFMEMEAAALKFKKVYGDLFTAPEETQAALDGITELAQGFTQYGIAVSKTIGLASEAAAAGFAGVDLQRQTTAATKLSVLGQIEQQQALETTISLQNAMGISSQELATSIDFLNAVENQTVTSLDDITIAIPKVAPVIKSLGGDVKDLAFFMTAMKEGGINASEGANALKSGLASMINPAKKSAAMLADMGININGIVEKNRGNLRATVVEFAQALDKLDPLSRARAIEQMFGKFQFARLSTLFQNVIKDGTQAERVLKLAGSSVEELAALSDKELGMTADSAMNKFKKSVEDLKFALVPVGKVFLEVITPFLEKISGLIERFNNLSDSTKKIITLVTVGVGAIAPVILMTIGLLANFVANGIKGLMILRNGYLRLTGQSQILGEQTNYLTVEQQQALAAAHSLEQSHARLIQTFTVESTALGQLKNAYIAATTAANNFAMKNPGMMVAPVVPTKRATGKPAVVGGTGNRDTELALLTPGETVIPAPMSEKYGSLINGMIADNIPGYKKGKKGESVSGTITKDPSNVKKDNRLYASPKIIGAQTDTMEWSTLEAEKKAIELATRGYLETLGESAEEVQKKIDNLQRVQASHINKEVDTKIIAGEALDIKQWNAPNLQADLGAINNFLNVVPRIADTLDDSKIAEMAGKLNITVDEFKTELSQLQQGIHPTTEKSADVLLSVAKEGASVDPSTGKTKKIREELEQAKYQSLAAEAVLTKRKEGDYYATLPTRAYDPAKDIAVAQDVANRTAKTQQALLSSFNISDEIAQISGKNAQALQNAWNALSVEQKEGLLRLKDDANAFTAALLNEAKEAGVAGFELGNSAIQGISKGIQDGSPSKKARQKGKNVSDGFEQGILEGMDDASLAGSQVGNAAVNSLASTEVVSRSMGAGRGAYRPQGPVPIGPVIPTGASLLPLIAAPIVQATEGLEKSIGVSASKLGSLNKGLNSVSFGLTAAAGAGTMFGGKIGEVSAQIFKYSGLMFGLMQITQLLTQAQVARLIAERAATAGILTKTVSEATGAVTFTRVSGLFAGGIKKLIPNLFKLAQKITQMLGPWGKLISIVIAGVFAFNKLKDIADAQREKIDGLGDAAFIAGDRLKTLADIFGVVPQKFAFESLPKTVGVGMTGQERTAVDKVRESEDFQKNFGKNIAAIRGATDQQAELLFRGLVVQLKGRGFAEDQVQAIVNAIKLESGKTDVEIDFASISILTPEGRKAVQKDIISLVKLAKTTREIKALSGTLAGIIGATQLAFSNGAISAQEYADQMSFINGQIASMPYPDGIIATNAIFNSMDSSGVLASTAAGITNIKDRLLVLNAIALAGLGPDSPLIKGLASTDLLMQDISRRQINKLIDASIVSTSKAAAAALEKIKNAAVDGGKDLSALSKKVIEGLKKELKLLEDKKKALEAVNDEIERQQEFQEKQQQLDADMVQAKISGNYIQAALLGQQKLYNKSQYDRETSELKLDQQIQKLQDRIDALENGAKVTDLDKKLANIENKVSSATKSSGKAAPAKKSGSAGKDDSTTAPKIDFGPDPKVKVLTVKELAEQAQKLRSNIVSDGYRSYHHFAFSGKDYFVSQRPSRNFVEGKFNPNGGITITGKPQKFSTGGKVQAFEPGGKVSGPGTSTSDSIPAYLSDGEYVFSAKAVDAAGGPGIVDGWHNALRRAKGGEVITTPRAKKPGVPYSRSGAPIGNPFGQYWGELSRFIGPRSRGMDIWGGTEIPGLKFTGKYPQHSDYMHQMLEQPRKPFIGPGMGLDKNPMRYAGSGASMGGIGNGAYGLGPLMFHAGGPVGHTHSGAPHSLGMSSMVSSSPSLKPKKATSLFDKSIWEKTANFFSLPEMAKTGFDVAKYGGPSQMMTARLFGAPMKSSLGDNATTALNAVPIPVAKLLKFLKPLKSKLKLPNFFNSSGAPFPKDTVAPTSEALRSSAIRSIKQTPQGILDSLRSVIWNTVGKTKIGKKALWKIPKIVGQEKMGFYSPFKQAYGYARRTGKSYFDDITNRMPSAPPPRPGAPGGKKAWEDDGWADTSKVGKDDPRSAYGELFGLLTNLTRAKVVSPINKIGETIKSKTAEAIAKKKASFNFFKDNVMPTKSSLNPVQAISNLLYRYTPYGTAKAKKLTSIGHYWEDSSVASGAGPEMFESIQDLAKRPFYHGGLLPDTLMDRSKPGVMGDVLDDLYSAKNSIFANLFDFDLFTTGSKGMSASYSKTKNTTGIFGGGEAGSIFEMFFPKLAGKSTLDLRGGQKSIWSQNKRAYAALEAHLARTFGIAEARTMLAGERVPGIAKDAMGQARDHLLQSQNLRLAFTKLGPKGYKYLIDTIVHEGGRNTGSISHPVIATLAPKKMVSGFRKILDGVDLKFFDNLNLSSSSSFRGVGSELEQLLSEIVARSADQKERLGQVLPFLKAGHFANGGPVKAKKPILGKPDPKQSLLNKFLFGQKYVGGNVNPSKGEIPFGPGGISKIIAKLGYKPINLLNQYMNYFKAKKMVKNGMFHGSADLGRNSDGPFSGTTKLVGDYGNDPYHGMGFYSTSSKSEADMYAGGYNVLGQWGESYGSMNKVTKIPFGRYLDFTKDLKKQNYGMWERFESQRDKGFIGAHEKLGSIMNDAGMTGAIMPRVSSGLAPEEMMLAKWIALNKPKGTMLEEIGLGFANGGMVRNKISGANYKLPSYDVGIGYVPEDQIAQLHKGERVLTAEENKNFSSSGPVTNNITINGADKDPKQIAQEVMIQLERIQSKNNKTNLVGR